MPDYTKFMKTLSDQQIDDLYATLEDGEEWHEFEHAVRDEWAERERITHLSFYTPNIETAQTLIAEEEQVQGDFAHNAHHYLATVRIFHGWSHELENAIKILIKELIEKL